MQVTVPLRLRARRGSLSGRPRKRPLQLNTQNMRQIIEIMRIRHTGARLCRRLLLSASFARPKIPQICTGASKTELLKSRSTF